MVPLLDRCGMDIALQAARFADPSRPMLRLQPTIPVLRFFFSPGRIGRLLRVIKGAIPGRPTQARKPVPHTIVLWCVLRTMFLALI